MHVWGPPVHHCSCLTSSLSSSQSGAFSISLSGFGLGLTATETSSLRILCSRCRLSRARTSLLCSAMAAYRCRSSRLWLTAVGGSGEEGLGAARCGRATGSLCRISADISRHSSGGRRNTELHSCLAWDTSAGEEPSNTMNEAEESSGSRAAAPPDHERSIRYFNHGYFGI